MAKAHPTTRVLVLVFLAAVLALLVLRPTSGPDPVCRSANAVQRVDNGCPGAVLDPHAVAR